MCSDNLHGWCNYCTSNNFIKQQKLLCFFRYKWSFLVDDDVPVAKFKRSVTEFGEEQVYEEIMEEKPEEAKEEDYIEEEEQNEEEKVEENGEEVRYLLLEMFTQSFGDSRNISSRFLWLFS